MVIYKWKRPAIGLSHLKVSSLVISLVHWYIAMRIFLTISQSFLTIIVFLLTILSVKSRNLEYFHNISPI